MDEMNTECILSLVFVYVCVGVADSRKRGRVDGFVSSSEKPKNRETRETHVFQRMKEEII